MTWIKDTFFGGAEKKAGGALQDASIEGGRQRSAALQGSADVQAPAIDEAARIQAEAAQRASDLELAGLGDAKDIFNDIVNKTIKQASSAWNMADNAVITGGEEQRKALQNGYTTAVDAYQESINKARSSLGNGFDQAMSTLQSQYKSAEEGFQAAIDNGRALVERELAAGKDALGGFEGGQEAFRLQLAMTGALGPDVQQEFYDQYQNSPETLFKLEQAAKLAASGGASGGTKLARLNELGLGIISEGLNKHFSNLGSLAERSQRQGENLATLSSNFAPVFAGLASDEAAGLKSIRTGLGDKSSNLRVKMALEQAGLDSKSAAYLGDLASGLGEDVGNSFESQGNARSDIATGAVPEIADFQKWRTESGVGFAGLGAEITAGLERDIADIEANRGLSQAGLAADTITGRAGIESDAMETGVSAYQTGRVQGAEGARSGIADTVRMAAGLPPSGGGNTDAPAGIGGNQEPMFDDRTGANGNMGKIVTSDRVEQLLGGRSNASSSFRR